MIKSLRIEKKKDHCLFKAMVFSIAKINFLAIIFMFQEKNELVKKIAFRKRHYLFKNYQPRSCMRFSSEIEEISMPFMAFPKPFESFAINS